MAKASLQEIFNQNRYQLKFASAMSSTWFSKQVLSLKMQGITANRMLKDNDGAKWSDAVVPGKLYFYAYDAKHKATLEYWDRYPLVFPYQTVKGGFMGLNMHYLPYEYRIKILNSLIDIDSSYVPAGKKLSMSWSLINGSSKLKILQPCVHMYLYNQLRSGLRLIHPRDWATAMLLPVQQFVGASNTKVWKDSINGI